MAVLELSSLDDLEDWTGERRDGRMEQSLAAAREVVSSMVSVSGAVPEALHRAATMMAAAMHERIDSTYGVEAFAVGGEGSPGFLTSDPTIMALIDPWRRPAMAASTGGGPITVP